MNNLLDLQLGLYLCCRQWVERGDKTAYFCLLGQLTENRAVLEPILADLDRLWEMHHWIPNPG